MSTARQIIDDALTFRLNRLSPGETADADTDAVCLRALNAIVDEMGGAGSMLFREALVTSAGAISTVSKQLNNTDWPGSALGDLVLGMSRADTASGQQTPMSPVTMAQYQAIQDKAQTGAPEVWADDGLNLYFWPVPTGHYLTIRFKPSITQFADTTTDYAMPRGYRSDFADLLSERMAPVMGGLTPVIAAAGRAARARLIARNVDPAIVNTGHRYAFNVYTGGVE